MADRPEHIEAQDALDRFEALAKRAERTAIRGLIQGAKVAQQLAGQLNGGGRGEKSRG